MNGVIIVHFVARQGGGPHTKLCCTSVMLTCWTFDKTFDKTFDEVTECSYDAVELRCR